MARRMFNSIPGLVVYLTAGDPDLATTEQIALQAIDAGADVIELGVPYSDPVADGPVIQRASERALASGTTLPGVLGLVAKIRGQRPKAGLVLMSYLNPLLRFGLQRFAAEAKASGLDAVLATDLTLEEADEYRRVLQKHELAPIFLAAPTSSDARLKKICAAAEGFLYAVSRTGTTGAQQQITKDASALVKRLKRCTRLPIAVGFGISNAAQFGEVGKFADAVVIGSAVMSLVEQHGRRSPEVVGGFVRSLRAPQRG